MAICWALISFRGAGGLDVSGLVDLAFDVAYDWRISPDEALALPLSGASALCGAVEPNSGEIEGDLNGGTGFQTYRDSCGPGHDDPRHEAGVCAVGNFRKVIDGTQFKNLQKQVALFNRSMQNVAATAGDVAGRIGGPFLALAGSVGLQPAAVRDELRKYGRRA